MRDKRLVGFFLLFLTNFEILLGAKSLETVQGFASFLSSGLLFEGEGNTASRTDWTLPTSLKTLPVGTIVETEVFWQDGGADLRLIASFRGKRQDETSAQLNANWAMLVIKIKDAPLISFSVMLLDHLLPDPDKGVNYRLRCLVRQEREPPQSRCPPDWERLSTIKWRLRTELDGEGIFDWWKIQIPANFSESNSGSFGAMLHVILQLVPEPEKSKARRKRQVEHYSLRIYDWAEPFGLRLRKVASPGQSSRLECFLDLARFGSGENSPKLFVRVGAEEKDARRYKIRCKLIPYRGTSSKLVYTADESYSEQKVFTQADNGAWKKRLIASKLWSQRTEPVSVYHPGILYIEALPVDSTRALTLTFNQKALKEDAPNSWKIDLPSDIKWWMEEGNASQSQGDIQRKNIEIEISSKESGSIKYSLKSENKAQWNPVSDVKFLGETLAEEINYFKERARAYQFSPQLIEPSMFEVSLQPLSSSPALPSVDADLDIFEVMAANGQLAFVSRASGFPAGVKSCRFQAAPDGKYVALVSLNSRSIRPFRYRLSRSIVRSSSVGEFLNEGETVSISKSDYGIKAYGPAILLIQLYNFSFKTAEVEIIDNNQKLEPDHLPYGEFHELAIELLSRKEHRLRLRVISNTKKDLGQAKLRYVLQRVGIGKTTTSSDRALKSKVNDRFGHAEQVNLSVAVGKIQLRGKVDPQKNDIVDYWYLHQSEHAGLEKLQVELDGVVGYHQLEAYDAYGKLLQLAEVGQLRSIADIAYLAVINLQASNALSDSKQSHAYQIHLNLSPQNDIRTVQVESDADRY